MLAKPQAITPVSFEEFVTWYPEAATERYELHNGTIVVMPKPLGKHSEIAGFLGFELNLASRAAGLPYLVPRECLLKPEGAESGYEPDVVLLDRLALAAEPRWAAESVITSGQSVRLAIEVVSTNWHADYALKLDDYEAMGIQEYWIVDYLGLGGRRYIGSPKQPTLSLCVLVEGAYEVRVLRADRVLRSPLFPNLELTVEQIFRAGS